MDKNNNLNDKGLANEVKGSVKETHRDARFRFFLPGCPSSYPLLKLEEQSRYFARVKLGPSFLI